MQFFAQHPFFLPGMHIVFSIYYGVIAVFLLMKDGKAAVYRLCALVSVCFTIWCLGKAVSHYPQTPFALAVFSRDVVVLGAWTFSSLLFLFSLALTGREHLLARKSVWIALFFIPVFSICLQWFGDRPLAYVSRSFGWGLSWENSVWTLLLLGHIFLSTFLSGLICLIHSFRCAEKNRRTQSLLIASCILGGMVIGYGTNYLVPHMSLDFPDLGQNIGIFWITGVVFAVIRYDALVLNPEVAAREILATLSDALFLTDPAGKILTVNQSGLALLHFQSKDLLGRNIKQLFPPGQQIPVELHGDLHGDDDFLADKDMQMVTNTGHVVDVSISVTILKPENDKPGGLIVVARDVEERIRLQKALLASHDELEKRVANRTNELLHAENRDRARQIIGASSRGKELVQQILTFSRHKAFELQEVNIAAVASETVKLSRAILPKKISIAQDIDLGCGCVLSDSTQLYQIMMNIVTNAHQAMIETGGIIHISLQQAAYCRFSENPEQEFIQFRVTDSGVGMDQQTLGKIFDPYFTTKEQGSGLGLAIAMAIIKDLKGYIDVTSQIGLGTCVDVYLPKCGNAVDISGPPVEENRSVPVKANIILVDDEDDILEVYGQILERTGYIVRTFNNPQLALDAFRKERAACDLLITDMSMPGMTGEMIARSVLKERRDLPVILCTGFTDQISRKDADKIGIKALLSKPVSMKRLLAAVQTVLDEANSVQ